MKKYHYNWGSITLLLINDYNILGTDRKMRNGAYDQFKFKCQLLALFLSETQILKVYQ